MTTTATTAYPVEILTSPSDANWPQEHVDDSLKLNADAIVELYHIILSDKTNLYLTAGATTTWQGNTYESLAIQMSGEFNSSDSTSVSRPQLVIANPLGIFSSFVVNGYVNKAQVLKYTVLGVNITENNNIYVRQTWVCWRIVLMNKTNLTLEVRGQLDGPNFQTPARSFLPPEFPAVSLTT
ncbi:hypothetical protein [Telmatospirillum sp.]|uniref:hypothetical protein n=1 Tax=Telmatospirillum sp. TaxID=2079197 RepID=UPI002842719E|nr:hypothetical protein [Telmatospirillum sp.]MDR3436439.1 hypothetical protein [Telmatospirillum sp.]